MKFHPAYVALPAVIFALSIAICAVLIPHIEGDKIAISFNFDGEPQTWKSLSWVVAIFLSLQAAMFLASLAAVYFGRKGDKKEKLLPLVGNFLGVGQAVVGMVMLEILWYNSYNHHLLPMMVIFGIILALLITAPLTFFLLFFFRVREKT
jgi:MFS family permease